MIEKYYLFYLLAFFAEIIGTVSGFGSSILFVPLASVFFDFKSVLGITALFHIFSNLSKIFLFRKGVDRNIVIKLGIPAVIFVIIGAFLSDIIPQKELEMMMSIFLVILSILLLLYSDKTIQKSDKNLVVGGIFSGFLAGLLGTGGSIRGLTLAAFNLEKDIFIASSAFIDLGVDTSRGIVYFLNGYILKEFVYMVLPLLLVSIIGSWVGKQILGLMSERIFKYTVLVVIILTSIIQTVKYFTA